MSRIHKTFLALRKDKDHLACFRLLKKLEYYEIHAPQKHDLSLVTQHVKESKFSSIVYFIINLSKALPGGIESIKEVIVIGDDDSDKQIIDVDAFVLDKAFDQVKVKPEPAEQDSQTSQSQESQQPPTPNSKRATPKKQSPKKQSPKTPTPTAVPRHQSPTKQASQGNLPIFLFSHLLNSYL
jgi:hypothetical protein